VTLGENLVLASKTMASLPAGCAITLAALLVPSSGAADGVLDPARFTMTAEVTSSQGTRSMPITLIVARPISREEAEPLKKVLESGGQQALLAALRGGNRGRLSLGGLEYPLDLVIAEPYKDGVRYIVVTTRALHVEEINDSQPSLDYPFSVAVFEVPDFGSGHGDLYRRAALAIDEEGRVRIESYDGDPGQLEDIDRQ